MRRRSVVLGGGIASAVLIAMVVCLLGPFGANAVTVNAIGAGPLGNGGRGLGQCATSPYTSSWVRLLNPGDEAVVIKQVIPVELKGLTLTAYVGHVYQNGLDEQNGLEAAWLFQSPPKQYIRPAVGAIIAPHKSNPQYLVVGLQLKNSDEGSLDEVIVDYTVDGQPHKIDQMPAYLDIQLVRSWAMCPS